MSLRDEREFATKHPLALVFITIPILAVATLAIGIEAVLLSIAIWGSDPYINPLWEHQPLVWTLSGWVALGLFFLLVFVARRNDMAVLGWLQVHRHVRRLLLVTVGWPVLLLVGWIFWTG